MALHGQRWRAVTDDTVTALAAQAAASATVKIKKIFFIFIWLVDMQLSRRHFKHFPLIVETVAVARPGFLQLCHADRLAGKLQLWVLVLSDGFHAINFNLCELIVISLSRAKNTKFSGGRKINSSRELSTAHLTSTGSSTLRAKTILRPICHIRLVRHIAQSTVQNL
jgi:hypothetical protein